MVIRKTGPFNKRHLAIDMELEATQLITSASKPAPSFFFCLKKDELMYDNKLAKNKQNLQNQWYAIQLNRT